MQSLLARNKNPSCKWNFSKPLPSQHLENGSAKHVSVAYKSLILSSPRILESSCESKAWRLDKASATTLSFPFLYLTMYGKDSMKSLHLACLLFNFSWPFKCFKDSWSECITNSLGKR